MAVEAAAAACIGGATRKPSAKQARRRARSLVPVASARGVAPRRARSLRTRAGAGADIARARAASCACACSMRTGLARAAAGPTEAVPHA